MMKKLLIGLAITLFGWSLKAQQDFQKAEIKIHPDSELTIGGKTNVNKFDCKFSMELVSKPIHFQIREKGNNFSFENLTISLLTKGFDCGNRRMNRDFQDLLLSEKYPEIRISLNDLEPISEKYSKAFISVEIAGKKKLYELPLKIDEENFIGKFSINIRNFGLEPPRKALGLIEVDEMIEVQFDLKVIH